MRHRKYDYANDYRSKYGYENRYSYDPWDKEYTEDWIDNHLSLTNNYKELAKTIMNWDKGDIENSQFVDFLENFKNKIDVQGYAVSDPAKMPGLLEYLKD